MGRLSLAELARRKEAARKKERYDFYAQRGICPICGRQNAALGHVYCQSCLDDKKASVEKNDPGFEKRKTQKRERYAYRVANHLCVDCGKPVKTKFKRCNKCLANIRLSTNIWKVKKKLEIEKNGGNVTK